MPAGDIEVYHQNGRWHLKVESEGTALAGFDTREEAVAAGRVEARQRKVELVVHRLDGTVGERDSEGHDPRDVPG
ncbi:hypothetical protein ASD11_14870 [Aeromicrobium sp. Root495]|uniref:DUF2188 domain-containing protein n=1 Tax=Aeromicrobium sp. Root495 TaxID=1736550 RepID=UPI0006F4456D|nr:DUF2188 domain-containing protein [Aeromicrobium sp. Root495]KQY55786.1 hypothetical protein ASD11_14870 [Aeromicrobium sp. Root495]